VTNQTSVQPSSSLQQELRETLLRMHGPLLGGKALVAALGHKNPASLRQARRRGQVAITLFTVPNRRGCFALTQEVADWLANIRMKAQQRGGDTISEL
jgi:hypothetical protein